MFSKPIGVTVALLAVVIAVAIGAPIAAADDHNATENESDSLGDRASDVVGEFGGDDGYVMEIDKDLRLREWRYEDGTFTLVVEADRSQSITLTEAVQFEAGSGSGSIRTHNVPAGETEISIDVQEVGGEAAVTITTADTLADGEFRWISTGQTSTSTWFDGQATWDYVYLASIATFVGVAAGTRHYKRKQEGNDGEVIAERFEP